jgi:hypothetical protein
MKTNNPFIDTLVESQSTFVNNWMDSAKKMQSAFTNGNIASEGQSLYKEYFDKQMGILNSMKESSTNMFAQDQTANPQEFFKNWFNQQAGYSKQMADFNQSINNSFSNFGKPAQDYMANFGQTNGAFTNIYNSWLGTLNNSYDAMSRNMNGTFNKDVFSNFMQGNQIYVKMQEFFQPMLSSMQKGQFNMDAFKTYFTPDAYSSLSKQMFGTMYEQADMKAMYDNAIAQLQNFFTSQNKLSKEYMEQMQNMSNEFPNMFAKHTAAESMKDFYGQMNNVFSKTFEPLMKLANAGKEKDNAEAMINLMDKMAQYSIKQAELQSFLQETTKKSVERIAKEYADKYNTPESLNNLPSPQDAYNEWVKVNEQLFTELFASEEFSKVKGEALNLNNELKKHFEKQFETTYSIYPIVFKSEVEEMEKTIYELKKQIKDLQSKVSNQTAAPVEVADEDRANKNRKK